MSERESAFNRCPRCHKGFRTLDDEHGMHDCPHCGYAGYEDDELDGRPEELEEPDDPLTQEEHNNMVRWGQ